MALTTGLGLAAVRDLSFLELPDSTALLDDHDALDHRYQEDGAVLVRAALDPDELRPVRDQVAAVLESWGIARWEGEDLVWTGAAVSDLDRRALHDVPALGALSEANANGVGPLTALCNAVYGRPTGVSRSLGLFVVIPDDPAYTTFPHRDNLSGGWTNPARVDTDYRRLWLPLTRIDFGDGGLALALGSHRAQPGQGGPLPGYRLRPTKRRPQPEPELSGAFVDSRREPWATASYELGDALIFHARTLHAGIPLKRDRIRIALAPTIALEGHPHEFNRTVPETEDDLDACTRIATALGASEAEAAAAFRLLTLRGEIAPDQQSVGAALAAVRAGVQRPLDFDWPPRADHGH